MLRTKLFVAAIAIALLAFAFTGYSAWDAKVDLALAQAQNEALKAQLSERQSEVDNLTVSVKRADDFLSQLKHERTLLDKLHSDQLAERAKLQAELVTAKANVNSLRQSHDHSVKAWADTRMPTDAVRLLKYAKHPSNHSDSGAASAGLSNATSKLTD